MGLRLGVLAVVGAGLLPGDDAREQREDQQGAERGRSPAQAAPFAEPGSPAGGAEVPFQGGETGVAGRAAASAVPELFDRLGQAAAPVEGTRVAVQLVPDVRCPGEAALCSQPFAALLDPAAQPGPGGEECLVREVDTVVVQGQQPGRREAFEGMSGVGAGVREVQFGARGGAAGVLGAPAWRDEPQQDTDREDGPVEGEPRVYIIGCLCHGTAHTPGCLVRLQGEGGPCGGARSPAARGRAGAVRPAHSPRPPAAVR